jgi:hypothetical protein
MSKHGRRTDKECTNEDCDSNYHRDGHELYCPDCGLSPEPPTDVSLEPPYKSFMERDEQEDGRTRYVGGYPDAYFGGEDSGEYEYSVSEGKYIFS